MQNFTHYSPTEIVFGKDTELQTGAKVKKWGGTKVLIVYGGGSAKKSGLLASIETSLEAEGIPFAEWGDVKPNPRLAHAEEGIQYAIRENVDFVLGVGGGSAIDTAKAIAHGTANPQIPLCDIWYGKAALKKSLPIGAVLTIAAAGSETSASAVLTDEAARKKVVSAQI